MIYRSSKTTPLCVLTMVCHVCKKPTNVRIDKTAMKDVIFVIPAWSADYIATCGTCWNTFKLDRGMMKQFERQLKEEENTDWIIKDGKIPNLKDYLDDNGVKL